MHLPRNGNQDHTRQAAHNQPHTHEHTLSFQVQGQSVYIFGPGVSDGNASMKALVRGPCKLPLDLRTRSTAPDHIEVPEAGWQGCKLSRDVPHWAHSASRPHHLYRYMRCVPRQRCAPSNSVGPSRTNNTYHRPLFQHSRVQARVACCVSVRTTRSLIYGVLSHMIRTRNLYPSRQHLHKTLFEWLDISPTSVQEAHCQRRCGRRCSQAWHALRS